MILDYDYNQREKKFVISYINEKGTKSFYECSVSRFKTYYPTPTGKYRNWNDGEYNSTDFDEFPEGFASATSNTNITCATAGHYYLKVDVMNRKLTADAIKDWGIIGSATPKGWDDETELTYNASEECWEGVVELVAGELKFRANHDSNWTYNFGGSIDNLTHGGANIKLEEAGSYEVKLYLSRSKSENIYCTLTLLK